MDSDNKLKKNVNVVFTYFNFKNFSGGPTTILNLTEGTRHFGIETTLMTDSNNQLIHEANNRNLNYKYIEEIKKLLILIRSKQVFQIFIVPFLWLIIQYKVMKWLKQKKIDAVVGRNIISFLLIGIGTKIANIPYIWDIGIEKNNKTCKKLYAFILPYISQVICQSDYQKNVLFSSIKEIFLLKKIKTIKPGITNNKYSELKSLRNYDKYRFTHCQLLCVGTINERKNQLSILKAITKLCDQTKNKLTCTFVGEYSNEDYRIKVDNYVKENNLSDYVNFVGWKNSVNNYYKNSHITVLASLDEGVSHVLRESMVAGTPVLSSPVGGAKDIIQHKHNGLLLSSNLTSLLDDIVNKRLELLNMGKNAATYADKNFRMDPFLLKYTDIIKSNLKNEYK